MKKLSTYVDRLNFLFWERVRNSTEQNVQSLAIFRIITGLFLLFLFGPNFGWLGEVPKPFFNPPILSIAGLFANYPPVKVFMALDFVMLACVCCIILGIRTRIAVWVYIAVGIFTTNFQFSLGKIDHSILVFAVLACMSFSTWGTLLALKSDSPVPEVSNQKALAILAVLIVFGFFTAGFAKAYWWLNFDFDKSGSAGWFYFCFYSLRRTHFLAAAVKDYFPWSGFKIVDYIAAIFEVTPVLFLLTSRKCWLSWLLIASIFHLVNLLVFNILFSFNAIAYLAFVDYSYVYRRIQASRWQTLTTLKILGGGFIACAVGLRVYYITILSPMDVVMIPSHDMLGNLYVSLILWTTVVLLFLMSLIETKGIQDTHDGLFING